jgi:hypothetical protein
MGHQTREEVSTVRDQNNEKPGEGDCIFPSLTDLGIRGDLVAVLAFRQPFGERGVDHVLVFHGGVWQLLIVQTGPRGEAASHSEPTGSTRIESYEDLAALGEVMEQRWGGWWEFLQLARRLDPDAHAAWVPEQIRRLLGPEAPRLESQDLALAGWRAHSLPAPGRALAGWETDALGAMAGHLVSGGWEVGDDAPVPGDVDSTDQVLGALLLRRYGWEAAAVVAVSSEGEIYARLAEPGEIEGPPLRTLTEAEAPQSFEPEDRGGRRSAPVPPEADTTGQPASSFSILELSSAHLPPEVRSGLETGLEGVVVSPCPWGLFVWVPDNPALQGEESAPVPPELLRTQLYARRCGCDWIRFDPHAATEADLAVWGTP